MKIAVISMIRDSWGGSEELWYEMAKTALAQGHEVLHLAYQHKNKNPKIIELQNSGLVLFERPGITKQIYGIKKLFQLGVNFIRKKIQNSVQQLFDEQPDVIIYNGTCFSIADDKEILHSLKNFKGKFFIIGHFNERKTRLTKDKVEIMRQVYQQCTTVFFTNNRDRELAQKQIEYGTGFTIIRNPVNLKDRSIVTFPHDKTIQMAMVGNLLTVHKGQDIVLNILKKQSWTNRNWQLNIYGSGVDGNYLKQLVEQNHLTGKVFFHGRVDDIRALWSKNHILLMPSRMEGMPLAIVEAMICGRPCIATDVGGITEWIEEGNTGFVADEPTEEFFENAMERSWQHIDTWEEMGKRAHSRAMLQIDPNPGQTLLNLITS
jgi:glycosyltransferase involved in cell wall biosynthesis